MQSRYSLPLLFILIIALASCGVKETYQRDIIIESDSVSFSIPIPKNITDTLVFATFVSSMDLNAKINSNTNKQFNIDNLSSASIIGFKINLSNTDPVTNNLMAFRYLSTSIATPPTSMFQFGVVNNNSTSFAKSIAIPIIGGTIGVKDQLSTGKTTYVLKGAADILTTKILQGKAIALYKVTLNK